MESKTTPSQVPQLPEWVGNLTRPPLNSINFDSMGLRRNACQIHNLLLGGPLASLNYTDMSVYMWEHLAEMQQDFADDIAL